MKALIAVMLLGLSASLSAYEKVGNSVVLHPRGGKEAAPKAVKVQVVAENIFRVVASPENDFSSRPSLIVEKSDWPSVPFRLQEKDGRLWINTRRLRAAVNGDGEVEFFDAEGRSLLKERAGGKRITPAVVMEEPTFHIQQLFESPDDEAFYGLGQHQYGWMNYKGKDVDLYQINIVAAVPFLVSSRKYGILWDNNSRTKFGDPEDYRPIDCFKLYDADGNPGALTAEYFADESFGRSILRQREKTISYADLDEIETFPSGFDRNHGSIRWSGALEAAESGLYHLRFYSSNYAKLWINDELVVDSWRVNWMPWARIVDVEMKAGERLPIRIEWIPNGGYIGLTAKGPQKELYSRSLSLFSEVADQIDYYFIHGRNMDEVIAGYRQITGKAPMMPKWAMGFWQCRQRYQTQEELLNVVKEFRRRRVPLDNIVQDWFYWPEDKWGDHDFDPVRFPDPEGMVRELHENLHAHIMISVWPKFYVGTENYEAFKKIGRLYMRNVEVGARDWVGQGYVSTFYDPYAEDARELFWKQVNDKLFSKGFDAWWLDATEPDIHSNLPHEEWRRRIGPTALGSASRYLNTYSLMNAKGIYEGQRRTKPDQRVFILTRSAYAGQQRFAAATWSGDIAARWHDMKTQIAAGLNFSLSGLPYWTMDIGGFSTERRFQEPSPEDLEEWREMLTRWYQFGAFCPLFRSHGEYPYREIYLIAPESHPAYRSIADVIHLRYRLMPYIYSLAGMVTHEDGTIMRALVMDFDDPAVREINDQYMFGPALLINPVTEFGARTRLVYLPSGSGWYDFYTGAYAPGGRAIEAAAPYEKMPIFVKAGTILPTGPALQYSDEKPADPLRLFVFAGADGQFKLYEDENVNYDYEKGEFAVIPMRWDEAKKTLTIGPRRGRFDGMLKRRTIEIVKIDPKTGRGVDFDAAPDKVIVYDGKKQTIKFR